MNSYFFYRLLSCSPSELHIWKNELALRERHVRLFLSFCPLPVGGTRAIPRGRDARLDRWRGSICSTLHRQ